jgi:uncharacterized membrane protein
MLEVVAPLRPDQERPPEPLSREHLRRSLCKAMSWRFVGSLDTFILSFFILNLLGPLIGMESASAADHAQTSLFIAATELLTKIVLYFLHERAWARLSWGVLVHAAGRRELHRRTAAKTASWRLLASLDTTLLALLFTGHLGAALSIGGLEIVTKLVLYYLHERAWAKIRWGFRS